MNNVSLEQILPVLESYKAGVIISHEHQLVISSIKTNICSLSQDLVGTNVGNWLIENNFPEGAVCGESEISSTEAGSAL